MPEDRLTGKVEQLADTSSREQYEYSLYVKSELSHGTEKWGYVVTDKAIKIGRLSCEEP